MPYRSKLILLPLAAIAIALVSTYGVPAKATSIAGSDYKIRVTPAVLGAIESYVTDHPGLFAGAWVDQKQETVDVGISPTAPPDAIRSLYAAANSAASAPPAQPGPIWPLRFTIAPYPLTELQGVMTLVTTAQPWARLSGQYLAAWYVSSSDDQVIVGMTRITASLRRAAMLAFGAKARLVWIERPIADIYQRTVRAAPRIVQMHRPADTPGSRTAHAQCRRLLDCNPLSGGDRIIWWKTTNSGTVISMCTLGFPWTPRGTRDGEHTAVAAGHCAPPPGISWYQGYYDSRHNVINIAHKLGPPSKVSFGENRADAEVIKTRKSIIFWAFTWISSSPFPLNQIKKYAGVMQNEKICANGSFTGENCHGTVKATNVCIK